MSVSARISARVNPVRATALDVQSRFRTKLDSAPSAQLAALVGVPSGLLFLLTSTGDGSQTWQGWRWLAHVGPYRVPDLVETGGWKSSLSKLSDDSSLTDAERAQALTDIEVVSQRRMAVGEIVKKSGFSVFFPIFTSLTKSTTQSIFEANLRIAMDLLAAVPAPDRTLNIRTIESILANPMWEQFAQNEDSKRFPEYRLLLLLKLLQNEGNLQAAKVSVAVAQFLKAQDASSAHSPFPALPLMPLLYQFKVEKLGYETFDIVRKIRAMLGEVCVGEEKPLIARKSLKLDAKLDFVNFEKLVYLTLCYSSIRILPMISEYSFPVLKGAGMTMAKSVFGVALLDVIYRTEEHLIQLAPFYQCRGLAAMTAAAGMVLLHGAAGIWILRKFPFCFLPFALTKVVRESFADAYRFT